MELKKMELTSASGHDINLEALYQIMPSAFTEVRNEKTGEISHKINFDTMRELLGDNAYEGADEEYGFKWVGKNAARREAARPINKTLRPCPEESVDWENTQNLYIEGDNLEVLKLLQKSYLGKIKMIYIDPPYNTGSDFVYRDDFALGAEEYDLQSRNVNDLGIRFRKNTETEAKGRFHSNWCSMIYERLLVSRSLLSDDGVIFISIDDNEVENLKKIGNEIFGESNFVGQWNWFKSATPPNLSKKIKKNIEYIIAYQKGNNYDTFAGVQKQSSSDDPITKPQNSIKTLLFRAGTIHAKFPDGIIQPGIYGTEKFPNELLDVLEIKNGVNTNDVRFANKFIWVQETLDKQIEEGTRINLSKSLVISYKKAAYNAEVPPNFIDDKVNVETTEKAGAFLTSIFGTKVFDYPKPMSLVRYLINFFVEKDENAIILDFFSGSATTAHAVLNLNAEDGGNRKFIMVQLPEKTEEDSEAYKAGYKNICEIGKKRICLVGDKIKEEYNLEDNKLDTGFRVFKCEDSFMNDVYFSPAELQQQDLFAQISNIKEGTSDLSMLFGCMLDWGVQLSLPLNNFDVNGKTIYNVNDGDLVACFAENINEEVISSIAEIAPLRVVFCDSCFSDAPLKMNLFEIFKQKCGWSEDIVKNRVHVI